MIDTRQFESIKQKMETLKNKKAKAEGAIESIAQQWKEQYGITTIEEAEAKKNELEQEMESVNDEISTYYKELNGLTNWGLV